MKKGIALLLVLVLALTTFGAYAQKVDITGPRGPKLPSTFEVDEEAGLSQGEMNEEQTEATMGTDVYLFVDPDSADYVTFQVRDAESNAPIENATIRIKYKGVEAVYGVTDEKGECSVYLFRGVKYEFTVSANWYEPATGTFTATGKTQTIRVYLRPYHHLTVIVKENGKPRVGVVVYVEDNRYISNDEGIIRSYGVTGTYMIRVILPDGRGVMYRRVYLDRDMTIVINLDDYVPPKQDAEFGFNFLVYDRLYQPEDYVLTQYSHKAVDVLKKNGETNEEWQARADRYLAENPNVIVVQAQPDREQLDEGDLDLKDENGRLIYTQRSMMPAGSLLREWEAAGYQQAVFANENIALHFELADLHGEAMTKVFALADMLANNGSWSSIAADGLTDEDLPELTKDVDGAKIDWSQIRPFEFAFDHVNEPADTPDRASHELVRDDVFLNTIFEFRITPVEMDKLEESVKAVQQTAQEDLTVIELADETYFAQRIQHEKALGLVTEDEAAAIGEALIDGRMYRVSCWIIHEGVEMDVTSLIPSLKVLWKAEKDAAETERIMTVMADDLTAEEAALTAVQALPEKDHALYDVLSRRYYTRYTVDVRKANEEFRSYMTESLAARKQAFALAGETAANALVWLNEVDQAEE